MSLLTATVAQQSGDSLEGVTVSFAATAGLLSDSEAITDANGQALVALTSPTAAATSTVTATCQSQSAQTQVQFVTTAFNTLIVERSGFIPADGATAAVLTARLIDSLGNPVTGQTLTFATSLGTLSAAQGTTDQWGEAQVELRSGQVGVARVAVSGGGASSETDVVCNPIGGLRLGACSPTTQRRFKLQLPTAKPQPCSPPRACCLRMASSR